MNAEAAQSETGGNSLVKASKSPEFLQGLHLKGVSLVTQTNAAFPEHTQ